jgi:DNA-binding response OmpR family regulator
VGARLTLLVVGHRQDDPHVVAAYDAGADAFVPLPCPPPILALRLRALAERAGRAAKDAAPWDAVPPRVERLGGWEFDHGTHEVHRLGAADAVPVPLSPAQFRLLHMLAANAGRTVPEERLGAYAGIVRVRQQISRLRHTLGLPAAGPGAIEAHDRLGYRLVPVPPASTAHPAA